MFEDVLRPLENSLFKARNRFPTMGDCPPGVHDIQALVPTENLLVMFETVRTAGRYPLSPQIELEEGARSRIQQ